MRQTKRRLELLPIYDRTGLERHMEKMARKGWMIENITNFGWRYRRIPAEDLHFCVCYYPDASVFDPEPGEGQQTFLDYCRHGGWELACSYGPIQIFYSRREHPVPIETEPMLEVESIHGAMVKTYLPSQCILLVLGVVMEWIQLMGLVGNVIVTLSDPLKLFNLVCWTIVILLAGVEVGAYFHWHRRAEEDAQQGIFRNAPNTRWLSCISLWVVGAELVWVLLRIVLGGNAMLQFVMVCMFAYMILLNLIVEGIRRLGKKWKLSKGWNRALTIGMAFLAGYGIVGGITGVTLKLSSQGFFTKAETYEHNGMTWTHYRDPVPLSANDLLGTEYDYVTRNDRKETIFLERMEVKQRPRYDAQNYRDIPDFQYTLVRVKVPGLYDTCKNRLLKEGEINQRPSLPQEYRDYYAAIDPAPWGAEEAYRLVNDSESWDSGQYLICYEDLLLELDFSWEVTGEQMGLIGQLTE